MRWGGAYGGIYCGRGRLRGMRGAAEKVLQDLALPLGAGGGFLLSRCAGALLRGAMWASLTQGGVSVEDEGSARRGGGRGGGGAMEQLARLQQRWAVHFDKLALLMAPGGMLRTCKGVFYVDLKASCIFKAEGELRGWEARWYATLTAKQNNTESSKQHELRQVCVLVLLHMLLLDAEAAGATCTRAQTTLVQTFAAGPVDIDSDPAQQRGRAHVLEQIFRDSAQELEALQPPPKHFMPHAVYQSVYATKQYRTRVQAMLGMPFALTLGQLHLFLTEADGSGTPPCSCLGTWRPALRLRYTVVPPPRGGG